MRKSPLIGNIFSLAVVQGAEYLVPLLAIPYLMRVLGADGYGQIAFAQALSVYLVMLTEFGFNLAGTQKAAVQQHDVAALSRTFWEVQGVKLGMAFLSGVLLLGLVLSVDKLRHMGWVLWMGLLPVLGTVCYPLWLLQGLEKMREVAGIMLVVRLLLLGAMGLWVRQPGDVALAGFCLMGAMPIAGVLSWWLMARKRWVVWARPTWPGMWQQVRESWHAFFVTASSSVYRSGNAVVLGFMAAPAAVAYYAIAEKLVRATQELSRPISQATYPRVSACAVHDRPRAMALLRKLMLSIGGLGAASALGLVVLAPVLVRMLTGSATDEAVLVLRCMALIPLVGGINLVMGVQTMLPFGHGQAFSGFVGWAGVVNLVLIVPLVLHWHATGAALAYLASEVTLLLLLSVFLRRQGVRYFGARPEAAAS